MCCPTEVQHKGKTGGLEPTVLETSNLVRCTCVKKPKLTPKGYTTFQGGFTGLCFIMFFHDLHKILNVSNVTQ